MWYFYIYKEKKMLKKKELQVWGQPCQPSGESSKNPQHKMCKFYGLCHSRSLVV